MQNGGALPVGQVKLKVDKTTNGNAIPPASESPVVAKPLPAAAQLPAASPVTSPETPPPVRVPPHQFRRPVDVFDSKLYQPTKLSEKVFIPVKDYPKVSIKFVIEMELDTHHVTFTYTVKSLFDIFVTLKASVTFHQTLAENGFYKLTISMKFMLILII